MGSFIAAALGVGWFVRHVATIRIKVPGRARSRGLWEAKLFGFFMLWGASVGFPLGCGGGGGGGSSAPGPSPAPSPPPMLALSGLVSGLSAPVGIEVPNDGTGRFFVIQQGGTIWITQNTSVLSSAFLDLTSKIESGGEKGLLGLAFHPGFGTNRRFFVHYTRRVNLQLQSVISEFAASPFDPNQADPATERQLLVLNQPFDNHNGGQLAFGPDGFLYIAFGDGGSGGDPMGNGQSLQTLLGKILRIDVDTAPAPGKEYAIPGDNPFPGGGDCRRFGPMACATPGGFPSIEPLAASLRETSARATGRKWT